MNLVRKIKQLEERITQLEWQLAQHPQIIVVSAPAPVTLPTVPTYKPNPFMPNYPVIMCGQTPGFQSR